MDNKKNRLKVALSFLKVGFIGFGGGSALIPVIEKEVVQKTGIIDSKEYTKHTIISNITPGTLPVKLGALSTMHTSLSGAYMQTIPGIFILILFLGLISSIGSGAVHYIEYASVGISTFIIFLLFEYIVNIMNKGRSINKLITYLFIMTGAFIVTGGKEVLSVISMLTGNQSEDAVSPIFDISTINLMIVAFFIILFLGAHISRVKVIIAVFISAIYIIGVGKGSPIPEQCNIVIIIHILMIVLTALSIIMDSKYSIKREKVKENNKDYNKKIIKNIIYFAIIPIVFLIVVLILVSDNNTDSGLGVIDYFTNALISTVTSFGGGEAYISIGEGFFVEPGFVPANLYYSQIVSIANALPGPILVKVVAAVGFEFGVLQYGSALIGIILAILGTTLAVGCSAIVALIVLIFFEKLKYSPRLDMIKKYILPVICGMLISTSLSMFYEAQKITAGSLGNNSIVVGSLLIVVLFFIICYISKKLRLNDVLILLISAFISLITFLIFTNLI